jgi:hypothetical protein
MAEPYLSTIRAVAACARIEAPGAVMPIHDVV